MSGWRVGSILLGQRRLRGDEVLDGQRSQYAIDTGDLGFGGESFVMVGDCLGSLRVDGESISI